VSVSRDDLGTIVLEGDCAVEDAEPLLQLLQATPGGRCDWTRCSHLHTAVVQVVLAAGPTLIGPCGDPWTERWIASLLGETRCSPG
jgi:hypothetical protein